MSNLQEIFESQKFKDDFLLAKYRRSFFQPYSGMKDLGITLFAPITASFSLVVGTALSALGCAAMLVITPFVLMACAVAALFGERNTKIGAATVAVAFSVATITSLLALPVKILVNLLAIPLALSRIVTRAGASVLDGASKVYDCGKELLKIGVVDSEALADATSPLAHAIMSAV